MTETAVADDSGGSFETVRMLMTISSFSMMRTETRGGCCRILVDTLGDSTVEKDRKKIEIWNICCFHRVFIRLGIFVHFMKNLQVQKRI